MYLEYPDEYTYYRNNLYFTHLNEGKCIGLDPPTLNAGSMFSHNIRELLFRRANSHPIFYHILHI